MAQQPNTIMNPKLKLNLGCGINKKEGYINVDLYGNPDLKHDLETFPWPWDDNTVDEIKLIHVLEHLGQSPRTYRDIWKEMYRICTPNAEILITVPHWQHDYYHGDPTHVRAITPLGIYMMSQRFNQECIQRGGSDSPLAIYWNIDFEVEMIGRKPSSHWYKLHPNPEDEALLDDESTLHTNLIEELTYKLRVIKPPRHPRI